MSRRNVTLRVAATAIVLSAAAATARGGGQGKIRDPFISSTPAVHSEKAMTLDRASVRVEMLTPAPSAGPSEPIVEGGVVNTGRRLWTLVRDNAPVGTSADTANALPPGVSHPSQLSGWRSPSSDRFVLRASSEAGREVVKIQYEIRRRVDGAGHLSEVTAVPMLVETAFGYKVSLDAQVLSVGRVPRGSGTTAAVQMRVSWVITTAINDARGSVVHTVFGDGSATHALGPTAPPAPARPRIPVTTDDLPVTKGEGGEQALCDCIGRWQETIESAQVQQACRDGRGADACGGRAVVTKPWTFVPAKNSCVGSYEKLCCVIDPVSKQPKWVKSLVVFDQALPLSTARAKCKEIGR